MLKVFSLVFVLGVGVSSFAQFNSNFDPYVRYDGDDIIQFFERYLADSNLVINDSRIRLRNEISIDNIVPMIHTPHGENRAISFSFNDSKANFPLRYSKSTFEKLGYKLLKDQNPYRKTEFLKYRNCSNRTVVTLEEMSYPNHDKWTVVIKKYIDEDSNLKLNDTFITYYNCK